MADDEKEEVNAFLNYEKIKQNIHEISELEKRIKDIEPDSANSILYNQWLDKLTVWVKGIEGLEKIWKLQQDSIEKSWERIENLEKKLENFLGQSVDRIIAFSELEKKVEYMLNEKVEVVDYEEEISSLRDDIGHNRVFIDGLYEREQVRIKDIAELKEHDIFRIWNSLRSGGKTTLDAILKDNKRIQVLFEKYKDIKEVLRELRDVMESFIGCLHDAIATDCLVPPSRSPAFMNKLIRMTEQLMLLEAKLEGDSIHNDPLIKKAQEKFREILNDGGKEFGVSPTDSSVETSLSESSTPSVMIREAFPELYNEDGTAKEPPEVEPKDDPDDIAYYYNPKNFIKVSRLDLETMIGILKLKRETTFAEEMEEKYLKGDNNE